jgi:hypothetical protein
MGDLETHEKDLVEVRNESTVGRCFPSQSVHIRENGLWRIPTASVKYHGIREQAFSPEMRPHQCR